MRLRPTSTLCGNFRSIQGSERPPQRFINGISRGQWRNRPPAAQEFALMFPSRDQRAHPRSRLCYVHHAHVRRRFYAAHLLSCLRDAERLRLVTSAFDFPQRADGSQYWCEVVFIQPARGGRFATEDPCGAMLRRHPELQTNVSRHLCCYARGDIIPDPKTRVCLLLAYFLAYSRKSREHVRRVSEKIRAEFEYEIVYIIAEESQPRKTLQCRDPCSDEHAYGRV
ncbi:hypothetical protein C8R47DRAFT_1150740 [Mycena vitilis]|nr:hypothetical protein C8R47DRAFT_1150740 [Mycena vitilis]